MGMQRFIEEIKNSDSAPFLFLGSGFSRRYMKTPKWDELLEKCAFLANKNYKQYISKVKKYTAADSMYLPHVAKMIAEDFEEIWWKDEKYKDIREENENLIINYASPLKIAIADYLGKFSLQEDDQEVAKEIIALKKINEKNSIDGIITTNWDNLAEDIFDFTSFIGQEKLLFSNVLNVGEIFKIHGCISDPNSMIFDENDYVSFNKRNHYLASKLTTIFIEHPIIFIGYSLRDDNIREILSAIIFGIGEENLRTFGKRIFFLEYNFDNEDFIYTTIPVDLPAGRLDITYIKTNNFVEFYEALAENERKFPARLVRQMKSHLYNLLLTDDPKDQIYVATDLENKEDLEKVQFVYGAGVIEKLSSDGYAVIPNDELFKDIVGLSEKKYDYKEIVTRTLLTPNKNHLPVYSFIEKSNLPLSSIHPKVMARRLMSQDDLLLSRNKDWLLRSVNKRFDNLNEMVRTEKIEERQIEYALHMYPEKIQDTEELRKLITSNINLLDNGKPGQKTNMRKLIKYYDWLTYGKDKKISN
ncbi:SIR2 family protein [Priestia megaterium]|uniref:SIR2 family protein n=1 Tax=Priestia megaterium TaxID=1404 RepID=UPI00300BBABB